MSSPRDVLASLSGSVPPALATMALPPGRSSRPTSAGLLGAHGRGGSSGGGGGGGSGNCSAAPSPRGWDSSDGECASSDGRGESRGERGLQELRALVSLPFFENLDKSSARKLGQFFTRRVFDPDDIVVEPARDSQGADTAADFCFHVLVRGRVSLSSVGADGSESLLGQHSNPAYFGNVSLVGGGEEEDGGREAALQAVRVRAIERCIVLSIGPERFDEFVRQNPNVRVALELEDDGATGAGTAGATATAAAAAAASFHPAAFAFTPPQPAHAHGTGGAAAGAASGSPAHSPSSASSSSSAAASFASDFGSDSGGGRGSLRLQVSLRDIPFFAQLGVPETLLQQLACLFEFRRCGAGHVLMQEGDTPTGFFLLLRGRVSVAARAPDGQALHLGNLVRGDWFGELALLYRTQRTAALTALQPCTLLFLSTHNFHTLLRLAPELLHDGLFTRTLHRRVGASLKTVPLFACLRVKEGPGPRVQFREDVLGRLGALFSFHSYARGTLVCREGEEARWFYIIHRGAVEVSTRSAAAERVEGAPIDADGNLILTELGAGDIFGELGLFFHTRRTANVRTLTDCVVLQLPSEHFDAFLDLVPEVRHTLDRVMAMRTAHTLSSIPFFRTIRENKPWSKLAILGSMFKFAWHPAGSVVVREGEIGSTFFVICDGSVEVTKALPCTKRTGVSGSSASSSSDASSPPESVVLDVLGRSAFFGEMALVKATIRLASVRCREDCLFLTVTNAQFDKFTQIAPDAAESFGSLVTHRTANMLRSIPFFAENIIENKPWSKLELLCTLFEYEYFTGGGVCVVREGDDTADTDKLFVLSVGSCVSTRRRRPSDPESDPHPDLDPSVSAAAEAGDDAIYRRVLERGSYFNDIALLVSVPRAQSVRTLTDCVFFTLTRDKFANFARVAPELLDSLRRTHPLAAEQEAAAAAARASPMPGAQASGTTGGAAVTPAPASSSSSSSSVASSSRPSPSAAPISVSVSAAVPRPRSPSAGGRLDTEDIRLELPPNDEST